MPHKIINKLESEIGSNTRSKETPLESEEKYKLLIEMTNTGYVILDSKGSVIDANKEYVRLSGHFTLEEIFGKNVTEWTAEHDLKRNAEEIGKCLEVGFVRNLEIDYVNREGKFTSVEINATVLRTSEGDTILTVCRDITARNKSEEDLKRSLSLLQATLDSTADGILVVDDTGKISGLNERFAQLWRLPEDILSWRDDNKSLGFVLDQLKDPKDFLDKVHKLYARPLAESFDVLEFKDGRVFERYSKPQLIDGRPAGRVWSFRDITEQKKAEETLRESEARFRDLFENVSDLIQSISPEGKFLYVNRAWRDTLGYSEEEVSKMSVFDIIHPDSRDHCIDLFRRILSGENISNTEAIFLAKDGRRVMLEGTLNCKLAGRKPIATRGIFRDITQRKCIEEQLNKVSHHNKLILNSTGEGILGVDLNGNHTFVNPEAARMLGYTAEELLGKHSHSLWHHSKPDGTPYPEEDCPIYAAIKNGTIYRRVRDEIFWRKDNSSFPVAYTSTPIIDDGSIVGAVLTFADISVQKKTEDALYESELRLRTILEAVQAGIVLIDAETHKIVDVNSVAAKLIGKPKEIIIGSVCHNYICPAEVGRCPITDLRHIVDNSERVLINADGTRIPVIKTVVPIMLNGQRHILESFVDITEQKKLEKQLLQSQKMDAIGQLAGGVAHDFNNILSTIIGSAHLSLMKITDDNIARQDISQILESAQRATALTQSLLAFGRKQAVDLRVHDINEIISGFEKFLLRIIREDIALKTVLTDEKLPIMADRGQIEQVLMNLATNARDAMPHGGELLIETKRLEIDEQFVKKHGYGKLDKYACITVTDSGMGMDEATKRKIFEPFFTTKEVGKGTGLGLAVVYGIVKKHDGYVNVVSARGKGSSFNIFLPITTTAAEEITVDKPSEHTSARGGSETILLAEDDAALRKLMTTVLSHHGYTVITAADGEEAVASFVINSECIDLVMLDGIMPRKNGKEVYKEISRFHPGIKVVFISGYSENDFVSEHSAAANIAFIHKPVSPSDLLKKVRTFLDGE